VRKTRLSVASVVMRVIHAHSLWRFFGANGYSLTVKAVKRDTGITLSKNYFCWIKSRYIAQRVLGLPTDRIIKASKGHSVRLRGPRFMTISRKGNIFAALLRRK